MQYVFKGSVTTRSSRCPKCKSDYLILRRYLVTRYQNKSVRTECGQCRYDWLSSAKALVDAAHFAMQQERGD